MGLVLLSCERGPVRIETLRRVLGEQDTEVYSYRRREYPNAVTAAQTR